MENAHEQFTLQRIRRESDLRKKQERYRQLYTAFSFLIKDKWDALKPLDRDSQGRELSASNYEYFADVYPFSKRNADKREIDIIKQDFSERGKTSEIAEYIFMQGIYDLQWLSEEVEVFPTHERDDIKSGIDLALRFEHPKHGFIYLSIDVKAWNDYSGIDFKRSRILRDLTRGKLSELEYFDDPAAGIKGKISLPKIIIIFNPDDAMRLQEVMLKLIKKRELDSIKNAPAGQKEIIAKFIDKPLFPEEEEFLAEVKLSVEQQIKSQVREIIGYIEALIIKYPAEKKKYQQCLAEYKKVVECWQ